MPLRPLIVLLGPTASGKSALAIALAQHLTASGRPAEILSCDSVAVYRHMQLGTAKPTLAERALIPHHLLDLYDPTHPCTAGDYARHARTVLTHLAETETIPILAGGTGLYARALLDGLFPAPPANPTLRTRLQRLSIPDLNKFSGNPDLRPQAPGAPSQTKSEVGMQKSSCTQTRLHRLLHRLDPQAATQIHPNDTPKLIRAIEVSLAARTPITQQWTAGRDALTGYAILRLTLAPPRPLLHQRINQRAQAMFAAGLVEETRTLIQTFGPACRPLQSLGYKQAAEVLAGTLTEPAAIALTAQGHRQYAKRQQTWFRRESELHPTHTLPSPGDDPATQHQALNLIKGAP